MIKGFSSGARWSINSAIYGKEEADKLSGEDYAIIKEKFKNFEEVANNFDNLSFNDKIDLCFYYLDSPNKDILRHNITPNMHKYLIRIRHLDSLRKIGDSIRKVDAKITKETIEEYNQLPIEEKIHNSISLLYGCDLFGVLREFILRKDEEIFSELYHLLEITSAIMEQNQSFDVERDVYNMLVAIERDKKLESLLSEL